MTFAHFGLFAVLLTSSGVIAAQHAEKPPSAEQIAHRADAAARPPTATLRYGPDALRSGELRKGPFPVAIIIHGGCWVAEMGGTGMQGFSEMLRKRGIATWDIDYRRVGHEGGGWPGTFQARRGFGRWLLSSGQERWHL